MTAATEPTPVLLVDDDRNLTRTLEDILPLHGFAPLTAASGREALQISHDHKPGLTVALIDLRLPDMDGLDLADQLNAAGDGIQVVILTGNATIESAVRALRDGGCDYLLKPVDPVQLVRTLRSAEGRWRLQRAEAELRQTRNLLGVVFDASPLPIVVLDPAERVSLWNRAAERVFGRPASEVIGRAMPADGPASPELRQALLRGEVMTGREMSWRRPDGTLLQLRVSTGPLGDEDAPNGFVAVYEDATHQRRLEAQLQHALRLDAMGRLVGGVAHDFNNLLAVMLLEIDAAVTELEPPPSIRQALESLRSTAGRGATLTRQLLSFARQQPAEIGTHGINSIVNDLARLLARLAGDRVELQLDLAAEAWSVRVDRGQLEQVLTNLVANARDAMPAGGRIRIATANVIAGADDVAGLEAGEWVRLDVTDTGIGMSEEIRSRIFEPFYTTKVRGAGTGLGLATCHGIVERLQGLITVESTEGKGSTFSVYVPRAGEAPAAPAANPPIRNGRGTEVVLLVEDQPQVRAVARIALGQRGYTVHAAATGAEALELVRGMERPPDLVFTDSGLPDMHGRDLIRTLRETQPSIRALITSGSHDQLEGYEDVPFLPKPYSLERLVREIRALLDQS